MVVCGSFGYGKRKRANWLLWVAYWRYSGTTSLHDHPHMPGCYHQRHDRSTDSAILGGLTPVAMQPMHDRSGVAWSPAEEQEANVVARGSLSQVGEIVEGV